MECPSPPAGGRPVEAVLKVDVEDSDVGTMGIQSAQGAGAGRQAFRDLEASVDEDALYVERDDGLVFNDEHPRGRLRIHRNSPKRRCGSARCGWARLTCGAKSGFGQG
jgi:hypothetical protein